MRTINLFFLLTLLGSCTSILASNVTGCITENKTKSSSLPLNSGEAIGQSFLSCSDGFLSHFSFHTSELNPKSEDAYINVYEVIQNQFILIHQGHEGLPDKLTAGKITFWINERVPVYEGREYAVEFLNLSKRPFKISYSPDDSYLLGSMIVNGKFTFSDLTFSVGIKDHHQPLKLECEKIARTELRKPKKADLFQSWSNKNLEIEYGDIGQSFLVTKAKIVTNLAVKIKTQKEKKTCTLEIYKESAELKNKIHQQEITFLPEKGIRWETISFTESVLLEENTTYFLSFKFDSPDSGVKFYYSTADPYKNGDMCMSDLLFKECDLSFFIQSEGEHFMEEIKWLEENDFEDLSSSPLTQLTAKENKFKFTSYPNPFDQQFMVSYENMDPAFPVTIAITNLSGTLIWVNTYKVDSSDGIITVHPEISLASGKYNLRVSQLDQVRISTLMSK